MSLVITGFFTVFVTLGLLVALLSVLPRVAPGANAAERRAAVPASASATISEDLVAAIGMILHHRRSD